MAWIESHQEIGRHPKTKKLARRLGVSIPTAVGHLHLLWHWAMDFAGDGTLDNFESWELADAAMWEGDPDEFVDALIAVGFIDRTDTGSELHDWHDYAGKLIQRRKEDAERKRKSRAKPDKTETSTDEKQPSGGRPEDVRTPSDVTVPYRTQPNQKVEANASTGAVAPKPRTPKQRESDRRFERSVSLFEAYCRGIGLDPDSNEAGVYRDRAFRELKPVASKPAPDAEDMERCTRWMSQHDWRDEPPKIPQVLGSYAGWVAKGKPDEPGLKQTNVTPFQNSNRSGRQGSGHSMSSYELADYARELERQGQ